MKKNCFYVAAMATMLFAACSQSEEIQEKTNLGGVKPIEFGTYVGRTADTRAGAIADIAALATEGGFGVFAYYTNDANYSDAATPNFMYNQAVTSSDNGSTWTYSPIKYWPNEVYETTTDGVPSGTSTHVGMDKLTFFAYAPYTDVSSSPSEGIKAFSTNNAAGDATLTYKLPASSANFVDVLWADPNTSLMNLTKPAVGDKITFPFKHALTQLGLSIQGVFDATTAPSTDDVDAQTTITVKSLTIAANDKMGSEGTLNLHTGVWTISTKAELELTATGAVDKTITKAEQELTDKFIVLPSNEDVTFTVTINYEVVTTDTKLADGKSTVVNEIKNTTTFTPEKGKKYKLKLLVGMTTVKMTATVTDWDDPATEKEVWLPVNK